MNKTIAYFRRFNPYLSSNHFNVARPITIDGGIRSPGEYELKSRMTIKDLILEAGGVSENVFRYKIELQG